jgi:hypothetical protein
MLYSNIKLFKINKKMKKIICFSPTPNDPPPPSGGGR